MLSKVKLCYQMYLRTSIYNRTGTQSPQGPPGPSGPFYQVFGQIISYNSTQNGIAEAECDPGDSNKWFWIVFLITHK